MATLNWDNENRRQRLLNWISQNDLDPKWWEKDMAQKANLEAWAKRQSSMIVKRIEANSKAKTVEGTLELLNRAIQQNDSRAMKFYAEKSLNENSIRSGKSKDELNNLTLLIQMVLCISD